MRLSVLVPLLLLALLCTPGTALDLPSATSLQQASPSLLNETLTQLIHSSLHSNLPPSALFSAWATLVRDLVAPPSAPAPPPPAARAAPPTPPPPPTPPLPTITTNGSCQTYYCTDSFRATLLTLYHATSSPTSAWKNDTGWRTGTGDCLRTWYGVKLTPIGLHDSCRVSLLLTANNLVGALPRGFLSAVLAQFNSLRVRVDLQANLALAGELEDSRELAALAESTIQLSQTKVSGTLPKAVCSTKDSSLHLTATLVSGTIPDCISNARTLTLSLDSSRLVGTLPRHVYLQHTRILARETALSGLLPESIVVELSAALVLPGTRVSGVIPHNISRSQQEWSSFELDITGLHVSGTFPPTLGSISTLTLRAESSDLSGTIPEALARSLYELRISSTFISGTLPPDLSSKCHGLSASNVRISGSIPTLRSGFVNLESSQVQGTLPEYLFRGAMRYVYVSSPALSGTIPSVQLSNTSTDGLRALSISGRVSGTVPGSLCYHNHLDVVRLVHTTVSGTIPACLSRSMERLELDNSNVEYVAPELLASSRLRVLSAPNSSVLFDMDSCVALRSSTSGLQSLAWSLKGGLRGDFTTLWEVSSCLLGGTKLAKLSLASVSFKPDVCFDSETIGNILCSVMTPSNTLVELDLSDTNAVNPRMIQYPQLNKLITRPIYATDFLSLRVMRLSNNAQLAGALPSGFVNLKQLDVSNTNYDLCAQRSMYSPERMERFVALNALNVATWERCSFLVQDGVNAPSPLMRSPESVVTDAHRNNLQCPQWQLRSSQGVVVVDSNFLSFFGCTCPRSFYFGRPIDYDVANASWSEYRDNDVLFQAEEFTCRLCPKHLVCDSTADPRSSHAPQHVLVGSTYPVYEVGGSWEFLSDRWRLVHAVAVSCQHPEICNVHDSTSDVRCRRGHRVDSMMCSECERGFFHDGLLCEHCFDGAKVLVPVLSGAAVVLYVVWVALHKFDQPGAEVQTLFFWFQLSGILVRVDEQLRAQTDRDVGGVSSIQRALNMAASFHPFALECVTRVDSFRTESVALLLGPVGLAAVVLAVFVLCNAVLLRCRLSRSGLLQQWRAQPRWAIGLLFTWSLMFFPVVRRIVQLPVCDSLDSLRVDDTDTGGHLDVSVMRAAPWIRCGSDEHDVLLVLAAVCLVTYVVPWLVFVGRYLYGVQSKERLFAALSVENSSLSMSLLSHDDLAMGEMRDEDESGGLLEGLAGDYAVGDDESLQHVMLFATRSLRSSMWYYPSLLQVRNMLLAVTLGVVDFDDVSMPLLVFGVLLVSLLVQVLLKPYRRTQDNALHLIVLLSAMMRYMLTLLAALNAVDSSERDAWATALTVMVYTTITVVVVDQWVHWGRLWRRCRK